MAITKLNSLAIPAGTVEPADISYPLTNFSSTGIDDNADATAITIDSSERTSFSSSTNRPVSVVSTSTNSFVSFKDTNSGSIGHVKIGSETNDMVFYANANERMRINSSGQIGIGTTSPNQKLHVYENVLGVNIKLENNDGAYEIQKYSDDIYLNLVDTGDVIWRLGTALPERMRFTGTGYLGVGNNSAPNFALHIKDTANSSNMRRITIESDSNAGLNAGYRFALDSANGTVRGGGYYFVPGDTDATTYLGLSSTDSDYAMVATRENNIGIGTTNPSSLLHLRHSESAILTLEADTDNTTEADIAAIKMSQDGGISTAYVGMSTGNHLVIGANSTTAPSIYFNTAGTGTSYLDGSTGTKMIIHNSGEVTKPSNPAFYANHTSSTATGLIPFGSEVYDVNSDYNTTTYRFTAPVAGYYYFYVSTLTLYAYNGDTRIAFYKNGGIYGGSRHIINKNNWDTSHAACLIQCSANDYIEAKMIGLPTSGATYGDAGYNQFFGFLVS